MKRPVRLFLTVRLGHDSVILKNTYVKKKRIFEYHKVINLIHQVQFSSEERKIETARYLSSRVTRTLSATRASGNLNLYWLTADCH
jgi:hypothetical protein